MFQLCTVIRAPKELSCEFVYRPSNFHKFNFFFRYLKIIGSKLVVIVLFLFCPRVFGTIKKKQHFIEQVSFISSSFKTHFRQSVNNLVHLKLSEKKRNEFTSFLKAYTTRELEFSNTRKVSAKISHLKKLASDSLNLTHTFIYREKGNV